VASSVRRGNIGDARKKTFSAILHHHLPFYCINSLFLENMNFRSTLAVFTLAAIAVLSPTVSAENCSLPSKTGGFKNLMTELGRIAALAPHTVKDLDVAIKDNAGMDALAKKLMDAVPRLTAIKEKIDALPPTPKDINPKLRAYLATRRAFFRQGCTDLQLWFGVLDLHLRMHKVDLVRNEYTFKSDGKTVNLDWIHGFAAIAYDYIMDAGRIREPKSVACDPCLPPKQPTSCKQTVKPTKWAREW
jgi:hypothetical protein